MPVETTHKIVRYAAGTFVVLAALFGVTHAGVFQTSVGSSDAMRPTVASVGARDVARRMPEPRLTGASTVEPLFPEPDPTCAYDPSTTDAARPSGCAEE